MYLAGNYCYRINAMASDSYTKSKKACLVSLGDKLQRLLRLQLASSNQVDRRWLNGFKAAGFHSGLISVSELKLEYMKARHYKYVSGAILRTRAAFTSRGYQQTYFLSFDEENRCELF